MAALDVAAALAPLSDAAPSGAPIEYDPQYIELETAARGVAQEEDAEGRVTREAEEPDWAEVERLALELSARAKDLRVAIYLARAELAVAGLPGFKDALALIAGYVSQYWPSVHPQLDPDDDNDPSIRVNTLAALCDNATVLRALRQAPLTQSRQFGRFSYRDHATITGAMPAPAGRSDDEKPPDAARLDAAFADTALSALEATKAAAAAALQSLDAIDAAFDAAIGAGLGPDFDPLRNLLREIETLLETRLAGRREEGADGAGARTEGAGAAAPAGGGGGDGAIRNRTDVMRLLDKISRYYADHEPSSPVPLLLARTKRLVSMSFLDILKDLTPGGVQEFGVIAGLKEEETGSQED